MATGQEICTIAGCGGKLHPNQNLYLHTLGGNISRADLGEFIECEVQRCGKCGHIQLFAAETPIRARS